MVYITKICPSPPYKLFVTFELWPKICSIAWRKVAKQWTKRPQYLAGIFFHTFPDTCDKKIKGLDQIYIFFSFWLLSASEERDSLWFEKRLQIKFQRLLSKILTLFYIEFIVHPRAFLGCTMLFQGWLRPSPLI